ncbi:hypothetical protein DL95DRAFT_490436, partial [Leptodontidium sp. 2 PMI_412]
MMIFAIATAVTAATVSPIMRTLESRGDAALVRITIVTTTETTLLTITSSFVLTNVWSMWALEEGGWCRAVGDCKEKKTHLLRDSELNPRPGRTSCFPVGIGLVQVGSLILILGSDRIVWTFLGDAYEPIRAWGRVATKLSKFN